ncbi:MULTISPECIES: IclR family transcriptional regulator [Pseudomonas]|jgi:DNA-binding IclR family transcriptional regulator|uniref:IclR family transcriptional regulator n=2 Tax=Pseudomonas TaxID=286 RepID=A0A7L9GLP3_9PSED|nr:MULTISPECIES: IclR family transcriptional regulator [Pseudomonas]ANI05341.1 IclR family transcriptional regulator [Pseudomonas putida SJTE-1]MBX6691000.1 IclR family transcriptional regulator [Pseudomonas sp. USTB-Z]MDD1998514.1 IclR family transcriptional regulator [Pseudomonas putida]MEB3436641.1 IclR family transcriptional regulator [Pseudomonas sp. A2]POA88590.1 IclR family transcriptional regulator [Pseudomonas sp. FW305-E2]
MAKASSPTDTGKQKVRSAEVGTDILKALAELSPSTSLSRLAEHVQMPASKVHRYLQALIASGFAEQDAATNHYGLGREALRVGLAALGSIDVLKVAAMPLSQLRDELNESCFIAVWGNQGATVVSIEPAVRAVTVVTQIGSVLPLLSSSTGLVFAAYLPERETQELRDRELAALQQTASDYDTLLAGIREQGLHHVHGLLMPGVDALSAPVFNALGQIAAVMTVVGPTSIFHADEHGPAAQRLLTAARTVSWRMGYADNPHCASTSCVSSSTSQSSS